MYKIVQKDKHSSMGQLFASLQDLFNGTKQVKVIIVGLMNAGKSTAVHHIKDIADELEIDQNVQHPPTIGSNVVAISRGKLNIVCWDLGGQTTMRTAWQAFFMQTDVIILVVDASQLEEDKASIVYELGLLLANEELSEAKLVVLANKQDKQGAQDAQEVANVLSLEMLGGKRDYTIINSVATKGEGLREALEWIETHCQ